MRQTPTLATIATEKGRCEIIAELTDDDKFRVFGRLPDGQIETPEIPLQDSPEQLLEAISQSWSLADWDLQWDEIVEDGNPFASLL